MFIVDSYYVVIGVFIGCVVLIILGLTAVRKALKYETLVASHEVGGYLLSVVGTMYAVLLGLVVVDSMTRFQQARAVVEQEANSAADVFLLAERFPQQKRQLVQELCAKYVSRVVHSEWKKMDDGKIDPEARHTLLRLLREVFDFEPETENQKAIYPVAVQETCQLWDNRRARTNIAQYGMPIEEWIVLIAGGIICTVFTFFFALDNLRIQITMTVMVGIVIGLNLFLVLMFGYPFSGDMKVHPEAFRVDEEIFERYRSDKTR
jgi:hypothetical protein